MKLLKYKYLEEEDLYEFYYEHKYKGVLQELIFRHPLKEPGYPCYTTWLKAGNVKAQEYLQKELMEYIEAQVKLQDEEFDKQEEKDEG